LAKGFIGDRDASFGKQLFDLSETEIEPMVQPDGVANNFGRKTMTLIARCFGSHATQSAKSQLN
jgi:hypothetical protein